MAVSVAEVDVEEYPPVRCGAIAARIACDPGAGADVLRAADLDAAGWRRVHEHWQARIEAEASRGRTKLRADYDSAYVTAIEAERSPITLDVYARLAEAQERGAMGGVLSEMRFPEDAWLHIHRSWIPRMVKDLKLAKQVRVAIAEVRSAAA